jgi:maltose/moltooligosaccharide transporter
MTPFVEIPSAIRAMPRIMWGLAGVYLFQWYALFCYWQNSSKALRCRCTTPRRKTGVVRAGRKPCRFGEWLVQYRYISYRVALVGLCQTVQSQVGALCLPDTGRHRFYSLPVYYLHTAAVRAISGFWYWLGQHDGHSVPDGSKRNSKGKVWRVHGHIEHDDRDSNVYPNHHVWFILKNFLGNDPRKAILFAGILLLLAAVATIRLKPKKGSLAEQTVDLPTVPVGGVETPLPSS